MATLQQIYSISQPQNPVVGRVMGALLKGCWTVLGEDEATSNHANRLALAKKVIADPDTYRARIWRLFLADQTVQAHIDDLDGGLEDSDIEAAVTAQFDTLATMEADE